MPLSNSNEALIKAIRDKDMSAIRYLRAQGVSVNDIDITEAIGDPLQHSGWSKVLSDLKFLFMIGLSPNYRCPIPTSKYYKLPLIKIFRNDDYVLKMLEAFGASPLVIESKDTYEKSRDRGYLVHAITENEDEERLKNLITTTDRSVYLTAPKLDLTDPRYDRLPDYSHIRGILQLGPGFTSLPEGLVVNSLDISKASIVEMPDKLKVIGTLTLPKTFFMSDDDISSQYGIPKKNIFRV